MSIIRWVTGFLWGIAATFLFVTILATVLYAIPRAVVNALRGFVTWRPVGFFLLVALAYTGIWLSVNWLGRWLSGSEGAFVAGFVLAAIGTLVNLRHFRTDVDERLYRNLVGQSERTQLPAWAERYENTLRSLDMRANLDQKC